VSDHSSRDVQDDEPDRPTVRRWRDLLASERKAAQLYDRLADAERGERAEILRELASVERRHAAHWERRLVDAGQRVPPPSGPGLRTRTMGLAARRLSLDRVLPLIERAERGDAGLYDADPDAAPGMAIAEPPATTPGRARADVPRNSRLFWSIVPSAISNSLHQRRIAPVRSAARS